MHDIRLTARLEEKLRHLLTMLVDQQRAQVIVAPQDAAAGYWFGGGNLLKDFTGKILLTGRYRNHGDSRTGVGAGTRGLELAIFVSEDKGSTFQKVRNWSKEDLSYPGNSVVSIEGSAIHLRAEGGYEIFVSSEKDIPYPEEVAAYQKPGTGVWTIDVFQGENIDSLDPKNIVPVLSTPPQPDYLHVKDPKVFDGEDGSTVMIFCDHPFTWSSANSGYAIRPPSGSEFTVESWEMVSRGPAWDVAGTRITNRMPVPRLGVLAEMPPLSVYFYDGLECYRKLEENVQAARRPRGYSCEEIGGALYGFDRDFPQMTRLSKLMPLFVSPYGTGCSRYVDTLVDDAGILAIWQQSQRDESQPLVKHFLPMDRVREILT